MSISNPPPRRRFLIVAAILTILIFLTLLGLEWSPRPGQYSIFNQGSPLDQSASPATATLAPTATSTLIPGTEPQRQPSELPSEEKQDNEQKTKDHQNQPSQPNHGNQYDDSHSQFLTMFPPRPLAGQERFLGYLPHSGFHNQRMALETAIRLAVYLNRTLLLPPLYMCEKAFNIGWMNEKLLLDRWTHRTRKGAEFCRDVDVKQLLSRTNFTLQEMQMALNQEIRSQDMECRLYFGWTTTPWTYFYDIPKLLEGMAANSGGLPGQTEAVRVFDRPDLSLAWLKEHLGIMEDAGEEPAQDSQVYWINDRVRFDYRILDDSEYDYRLHPEPPMPVDPAVWKSRYNRTILLSDLQARPERLLHFGSLFGIERVEARSDMHQTLQQYITDNMFIWNKDILNATQLALDQIEKWSKATGRAVLGFLGVHLRTIDGSFVHLVNQNLNRMEFWIEKAVEQDQMALNTTLSPNRRRTTLGRRQENVPVPPTFLDLCMGQPPDSPLIFLATDVHHPRESPLLTEYFQKYPCTMILSDFPESVDLLDGIKNPVDNIHMLPYLIALMDANMAAHGRLFHGTEASTFSLYITNHLWPRYHPGQTNFVLEEESSQ
ncbi:hypothetical protein EDD11_003981 [Mortierella claussenii]|nr:hypothetical protein EDD11_003981 [Mortierella claussenii]